MPRVNRMEICVVDEIQVFHRVNRCVRQTVLCGEDVATGKDLFYSHKETQEDTKNKKNVRDESGQNVDLDYLKQFGWMVSFVLTGPRVCDSGPKVHPFP